MYWLNEASRDFLSQGYLDEGETAEQRLKTISDCAESILGISGFSEKFYDYLGKGFYSLSSPVWANFGKKRALPISCVVGETWINTLSGGGKQAKDIQTGDFVLTHKGRYRRITNIVLSEKRENIYVLKVANRMTPIKLTGDHRVLTNMGWEEVQNLNLDQHLVAINGDIDFVDSDNPKIDLKVFCPYDYVIKEGRIYKPLVKGQRKWAMSLRKNKETVDYFSNPFETIEVDEDLGWFFGFWFAEGSLSTNKKIPNGIRVTGNAVDERALIEKWLEIGKRKFGINGSLYESRVIRKEKENKWLNANLNSNIVGAFFESFGRGCKNKTIPDWLMRSNKKILSSFLEGILAGDGHKQKNSNKITLSNPKLLLQVYQIGLILGKSLSLQMQEKPSKLSTIPHVYTVLFRNYTGLGSSRHGCSIKFNDGLFYSKIQSLKKTGLTETVYDFTVEEDHSFSAAGVILHNCYNSHVSDSVAGILKTTAEVGMMTKLGGGTSAYFGDVRCAGSPISTGGYSEGAISFLKLFETVSTVCKQSSVRRGSFAAYLPIDHGDIKEFLKVRTRGNNIQHIFPAITVPDYWMRDMISGDFEKREIWAEVIKCRTENGTPYIMFSDNVNNNKPKWYKARPINASNLCVAPEQLLLTDKGYLPIGSLEGQNINVWNGEEWSETLIVKTSNESELIKVRFSDQTEIYCTPWHKFYVNNDYWANSKEIRAHALSVGDKIEKHNLPLDLTLDKKLSHAYSLGFYSGDGCEGYDFSWIYREKEEVISGITIGKVGSEFTKYGRVLWNHGPLEKFFVPLGYDNFSKVDWLAGFLDAEGCVIESDNCQNIQAVSVNLGFVKQVRLMLQEMGVNSSLSHRREEGNRFLPKNDGSGESKEYFCQTVWLLSINGFGVKRLLSLGFNPRRLKLSKIQNPNRDASRFVTVESVEWTGRKDRTYCANEPLRHRLVFNGVSTGNCSEICLPSNEEESFVCCLSSLNLLHWDEIVRTDAVETLIYFLDAVMEEFIQKSKGLEFMERARRFAVNHRALGLGVLGWHSYLQSRMIPFESLQANLRTGTIFRAIQERTFEASDELAKRFGEAPVCSGFGRRNATTMAIAPTTSSSFILGQVSKSVEPEFSNYHVKNRAKTRFSFKNPYLEKLLEYRQKNTDTVWESSLAHDGSVQHFDFLRDEEKAVFKTFGEISQKEIITQAAIRQKCIDQSQSLNLMIHPNTPAKEINKLLIYAWENGIKTLYYQHSINAAQQVFRDINSCKSCEA